MASKTGTSMSTVEKSNRYCLKRARELRAEERSWKAKSGPVLIYYRPLEDADHRPAA